MAEINNEMTTARAKADADAGLYRASKEAEANRARLTPEFIQYEAVRGSCCAAAECCCDGGAVVAALSVAPRRRARPR